MDCVAKPDTRPVFHQRSFVSAPTDRRLVPASRFPLVLGDGTQVDADRRVAPDRRASRDLSRLQLFRGVPRDVLEQALGDCPVRSFYEESVLLRPGDRNDRVYLLLSGRLDVHLDSSDSDNGIAIEQGGCIGELSIIDGKPASAFVVARPGTQLLAIDEHRFWSDVATHPGVARNLMTILSERMRVNNEAVLNGMRQRLVLEHVQKELRLAREIQESMLPQCFPQAGEAAPLEAFASMSSAREVGGDLYDFFHTADGKAWFAVGDVSDKGMPAALFMARTVDLVRVVARLMPDPGDPGRRLAAIMGHVNRELCQNNGSTMFVTLLIGLYDPARATVHLCNAGHPAPYLLRGTGALRTLEAPQGIPLGIVPEREWTCLAQRLEPGDAIFAFSDGVTEAMDARGEFFGESRLEHALARTPDHHPARLVEAVTGAVDRFAGASAHSDDVTALAVRCPASGP